MKTKVCIVALLMLVCLLATTILVSASEDDCFGCEEREDESPGFQKLYCKVFDIRETILNGVSVNKITLEVETRTHPTSDKEHVTFYNVSDYQIQTLHDYKYIQGEGANHNSWVNIFYDVNDTGVCHILLVEQADSPRNAGDFIILVIGFIAVLFVGIFLGWISSSGE